MNNTAATATIETPAFNFRVRITTASGRSITRTGYTLAEAKSDARINSRYMDIIEADVLGVTGDTLAAFIGGVEAIR